MAEIYTTTNPPIFFPPPPTAPAADTNSNKSAGFKFNFKTRPGTSDSSNSNSSTSSIQKTTSTPPPAAVQQPRSSSPKQTKSKVLAIKRTRQYILLSQLLLSFSILILAVMFAYCAALPHSDNTRSASTSTSTPTPTPSSSLSSRSLLRFRHRSNRDLSLSPPSPSSSSLDTIVAEGLSEDASNNALFTTHHAIAALTFYSATLPLLTLAHTATELLSSLVRPETSQHTRIGDIVLFRDASQRLSGGRERLTTQLSLAVSVLLALGWTVMQGFWINCEVVGFMGSPASNGEGVCPVQIRGHRMLGISQLSVGKVAMGWVVVVIYILYAVFMYLKLGVLRDQQRQRQQALGEKNMVSFRRKARFERGGATDRTTGIDRTQKGANVDADTDSETVFIGIDVEKSVR